MKTIAILSGRFHPFHLGHKEMYSSLVEKFGEENVFVATTDVTSPLTSPFSFEEKKRIIVAAGIPENKVVKVKNPYKAIEVYGKYDADSTAIVYAISDKDNGRIKFGEKTYFQPYKGLETLSPLSKHGYVIHLPVKSFTVSGKTVGSATTLRSLYIKSNDAQREKILKSLYPNDRSLKPLFDKKLAVVESAITIIIADRSGMLTEDTVANKKSKQLVESILTKESLSKGLL